LLSPFDGNEAAWMIVSEDGSEAYVSYFRVLAEPQSLSGKLRLKGWTRTAITSFMEPDRDLAGISFGMQDWPFLPDMVISKAQHGIYVKVNRILGKGSAVLFYG